MHKLLNILVVWMDKKTDNYVKKYDCELDNEHDHSNRLQDIFVQFLEWKNQGAENGNRFL